MGEKSFPILMQIALHENHIFQNFTDWLYISITDHLQGKFLHYTLQRKRNRRVDWRVLFSQQNPVAVLIVVLIVETINLPLCCCRWNYKHWFTSLVWTFWGKNCGARFFIAITQNCPLILSANFCFARLSSTWFKLELSYSPILNFWQWTMLV